MLLEQVRKYDDAIRKYDVERFRKEESSYELIGSLLFIDRSRLYLRDYLFRDQTRKYAYHWQSPEEELIIRWDNAPHWKEIETYPHHKRVEVKRNVKKSDVRSIRDVFQTIYERLTD